MKDIIFVIIGIIFTLAGVTLIFKFWPQVVVFFQGTFGILFAIVGLVMIYSVSNKFKK